MNNYEISLIIPVHNSSNFVDIIYNNISSQIFTNFEVLIIDDHSRDNTKEALKEKFKNTKFKYRILSSKGNGVSAARNMGIEKSQGKYVAFIDDDDEIVPDYLEILHTHVTNDNTPIALGNYSEITQDKETPFKFKDTGIFYNEWIINKLIPQAIFPLEGEQSIWLPVWRTIIKRDIIISNNIKFDEKISQAEDFLFMIELLLKAERISIISGKSIYFYNRRQSSAMNKYIENDIEKQKYFHKQFYNLLNENNLYNLYRKRYLSNRVKMYSTLISNAARASSKKVGIQEIKKSRELFLKDDSVNSTSLKSLYNSKSIRFAIYLLLHNQIVLLYSIYRLKEKKRLNQFN